MSDPTKGSIAREGAYVVIRVPLDEVHSLRVALVECDCPMSPRRNVSNATKNIRQRLSDGLARATASKLRS